MSFLTRDIRDALRAPECDCAGDTAVRRLTVSGGSIQFKRQCLTCGRPVGNAIAKSVALAGGPVEEWDQRLADDWRKGIDIFYEKNAFALEQLKKEKSSAWWSKYSEYLRTSVWRDRRDKVLRRANYFCEGCGSRKATQVHHLTYAHVGNEFLFELVAICDQCHRYIHEESE